jgi:rhodanese-related sulfurtransferase
MISEIGPDTLRAILEGAEPFALFDVRERGEYALGQIFGAVPLPRGLLEVRLEQLVPWRTVPVIVYCDDGFRSGKAAETLDALGYKSVSVLARGLNAWLSGGFPMVRGVNLLGKEHGERVAVESETPHVTPDDVVSLRKRGERLYILDARTYEEYQNGHLPGAFCVPGGELPRAVLGLLERPETAGMTIVVNCAGRTRSILGADILHRLGAERVFALENGTMAWIMAGYGLEYGPGNPLVVSPSEEVHTAAARFAERIASEEGVTGITVADLLQLRENRALHYALDVRLPEEFLDAHIPEAISCPGGQIANAADELIAVRRARIVTVSNTATRSQIGAALLKRIGYPDVTYLSGGLAAWNEAGLELASGKARLEVPGLSQARAQLPTLTPSELSTRLGRGQTIRLVDVRRSSEYALKHIPGSTWVPRGDLERRAPVSVPSTDLEIALVSEMGIRAALAGKTLREMGYSRVFVLQGGLEAWTEAGYPTEEGLDGADVSLAEAKEDVDLVRRSGVLSRDHGDMIHYLEWEQTLGEKYRLQEGTEGTDEPARGHA